MKFNDTIVVVLITFLFMLILPGLVAASGSILLIYFDALQALPPVATRLGFAAAGMIVVSLIVATYLKAQRDFIKLPALLTLTGIVLIPLQAGLTKAFSSSEITKSPALMSSMQHYLDGTAHSILQIIPVVLLCLSLFLMAGELTDLTYKKLRSSEK